MWAHTHTCLYLYVRSSQRVAPTEDVFRFPEFYVFIALENIFLTLY